MRCRSNQSQSGYLADEGVWDEQKGKERREKVFMAAESPFCD